MLRLDELKAEIKGEFYLQEELNQHNVKPAGKKDLLKALRMLEKSGFPHLVINSKGRVVFPDRRFHGVVIITDLKL